MPEELNELLYQLPVACLMLVVVWRFLVFIKDRDTTWLDTVKEIQDKFIKEIDKHQAEDKARQEEALKVIRQNTSALSQATHTLDKVEEKLQQEAFVRDQVRRAKG